MFRIQNATAQNSMANMGFLVQNSQRADYHKNRRISRQRLLKMYDDVFSLPGSRKMAVSVERYIKQTPKHYQLTTTFVKDIRSKIIFIHDYNCQVAQLRPCGRYPKTLTFVHLLVHYVELEQQVIVKEGRDAAYADVVGERVQRLLRHIFAEVVYYNNPGLTNEHRRKCSSASVIKVLTLVRHEFRPTDSFVDKIAKMLFVALGIDKIIENMKSNQSPFSKKSVRLTFQEFFPDLTSTSDYESEHSDEEYNFDDVSDNSDDLIKKEECPDIPDEHDDVSSFQDKFVPGYDSPSTANSLSRTEDSSSCSSSQMSTPQQPMQLSMLTSAGIAEFELKQESPNSPSSQDSFNSASCQSTVTEKSALPKRVPARRLPNGKLPRRVATIILDDDFYMWELDYEVSSKRDLTGRNSKNRQDAGHGVVKDEFNSTNPDGVEHTVVKTEVTEHSVKTKTIDDVVLILSDDEETTDKLMESKNNRKTGVKNSSISPSSVKPVSFNSAQKQSQSALLPAKDKAVFVILDSDDEDDVDNKQNSSKHGAGHTHKTLDTSGYTQEDLADKSIKLETTLVEDDDMICTSNDVNVAYPTKQEILDTSAINNNDSNDASKVSEVVVKTEILTNSNPQPIGDSEVTILLSDDEDIDTEKSASKGTDMLIIPQIVSIRGSFNESNQEDKEFLEESLLLSDDEETGTKQVVEVKDSVIDEDRLLNDNEELNVCGYQEKETDTSKPIVETATESSQESSGPPVNVEENLLNDPEVSANEPLEETEESVSFKCDTIEITNSGEQEPSLLDEDKLLNDSENLPEDATKSGQSDHILLPTEDCSDVIETTAPNEDKEEESTENINPELSNVNVPEKNNDDTLTPNIDLPELDTNKNSNEQNADEDDQRSLPPEPFKLECQETQDTSSNIEKQPTEKHDPTHDEMSDSDDSEIIYNRKTVTSVLPIQERQYSSDVDEIMNEWCTSEDDISDYEYHMKKDVNRKQRMSKITNKHLVLETDDSSSKETFNMEEKDIENEIFNNDVHLEETAVKSSEQSENEIRDIEVGHQEVIKESEQELSKVDHESSDPTSEDVKSPLRLENVPDVQEETTEEINKDCNEASESALAENIVDSSILSTEPCEEANENNQTILEVVSQNEDLPEVVSQNEDLPDVSPAITFEDNEKQLINENTVSEETTVVIESCQESEHKELQEQQSETVESNQLTSDYQEDNVCDSNSTESENKNHMNDVDPTPLNNDVNETTANIETDDIVQKPAEVLQESDKPLEEQKYEQAQEDIASEERVEDQNSNPELTIKLPQNDSEISHVPSESEDISNNKQNDESDLICDSKYEEQNVSTDGDVLKTEAEPHIVPNLDEVTSELETETNLNVEPRDIDEPKLIEKVSESLAPEPTIIPETISNIPIAEEPLPIANPSEASTEVDAEAHVEESRDVDEPKLIEHVAENLESAVVRELTIIPETISNMPVAEELLVIANPNEASTEVYLETHSEVESQDVDEPKLLETVSENLESSEATEPTVIPDTISDISVAEEPLVIANPSEASTEVDIETHSEVESRNVDEPKLLETVSENLESSVVPEPTQIPETIDDIPIAEARPIIIPNPVCSEEDTETNLDFESQDNDKPTMLDNVANSLEISVAPEIIPETRVPDLVSETAEDINFVLDLSNKSQVKEKPIMEDCKYSSNNLENSNISSATSEAFPKLEVPIQPPEIVESAINVQVNHIHLPQEDETSNTDTPIQTENYEICHYPPENSLLLLCDTALNSDSVPTKKTTRIASRRSPRRKAFGPQLSKEVKDVSFKPHDFMATSHATLPLVTNVFTNQNPAQETPEKYTSEDSNDSEDQLLIDEGPCEEPKPKSPENYHKEDNTVLISIPETGENFPILTQIESPLLTEVLTGAVPSEIVVSSLQEVQKPETDNIGSRSAQGQEDSNSSEDNVPLSSIKDKILTTPPKNYPENKISNEIIDTKTVDEKFYDFCSANPERPVSKFKTKAARKEYKAEELIIKLERHKNIDHSIPKKTLSKKRRYGMNVVVKPQNRRGRKRSNLEEHHKEEQPQSKVEDNIVIDEKPKNEFVSNDENIEEITEIRKSLEDKSIQLHSKKGESRRITRSSGFIEQLHEELCNTKVEEQVPVEIAEIPSQSNEDKLKETTEIKKIVEGKIRRRTRSNYAEQIEEVVAQIEVEDKVLNEELQSSDTKDTPKIEPVVEKARRGRPRKNSGINLEAERKISDSVKSIIEFVIEKGIEETMKKFEEKVETASEIQEYRNKRKQKKSSIVKNKSKPESNIAESISTENMIFPDHNIEMEKDVNVETTKNVETQPEPLKEGHESNISDSVLENKFNSQTEAIQSKTSEKVPSEDTKSIQNVSVKGKRGRKNRSHMEANKNKIKENTEIEELPVPTDSNNLDNSPVQTSHVSKIVSELESTSKDIPEILEDQANQSGMKTRNQISLKHGIQHSTEDVQEDKLPGENNDLVTLDNKEVIPNIEECIPDTVDSNIATDVKSHKEDTHVTSEDGLLEDLKLNQNVSVKTKRNRKGGVNLKDAKIKSTENSNTADLPMETDQLECSTTQIIGTSNVSLESKSESLTEESSTVLKISDVDQGVSVKTKKRRQSRRFSNIEDKKVDEINETKPKVESKSSIVKVSDEQKDLDQTIINTNININEDFKDKNIPEINTDEVQPLTSELSQDTQNEIKSEFLSDEKSQANTEEKDQTMKEETSQIVTHEKINEKGTSVEEKISTTTAEEKSQTIAEGISQSSAEEKIEEDVTETADFEFDENKSILEMFKIHSSRKTDKKKKRKSKNRSNLEVVAKDNLIDKKQKKENTVIESEKITMESGSDIKEDQKTVTESQKITKDIVKDVTIDQTESKMDNSKLNKETKNSKKKSVAFNEKEKSSSAETEPVSTELPSKENKSQNLLKPITMRTRSKSREESSLDTIVDKLKKKLESESDNNVMAILQNDLPTSGSEKKKSKQKPDKVDSSITPEENQLKTENSSQSDKIKKVDPKISEKPLDKDTPKEKSIKDKKEKTIVKEKNDKSDKRKRKYEDNSANEDEKLAKKLKLNEAEKEIPKVEKLGTSKSTMETTNDNSKDIKEEKSGSKSKHKHKKQSSASSKNSSKTESSSSKAVASSSNHFKTDDDRKSQNTKGVMEDNKIGKSKSSSKNSKSDKQKGKFKNESKDAISKVRNKKSESSKVQKENLENLNKIDSENKTVRKLIDADIFDFKSEETKVVVSKKKINQDKEKAKPIQVNNVIPTVLSSEKPKDPVYMPRKHMIKKYFEEKTEFDLSISPSLSDSKDSNNQDLDLNLLKKKLKHKIITSTPIDKPTPKATYSKKSLIAEVSGIGVKRRLSLESEDIVETKSGKHQDNLETINDITEPVNKLSYENEGGKSDNKDADKNICEEVASDSTLTTDAFVTEELETKSTSTSSLKILQNIKLTPTGCYTMGQNYGIFDIPYLKNSEAESSAPEEKLSEKLASWQEPCPNSVLTEEVVSSNNDDLEPSVVAQEVQPVLTESEVVHETYEHQITTVVEKIDEEKPNLNSTVIHEDHKEMQEEVPQNSETEEQPILEEEIVPAVGESMYEEVVDNFVQNENLLIPTKEECESLAVPDNNAMDVSLLDEVQNEEIIQTEKAEDNTIVEAQQTQETGSVSMEQISNSENIVDNSVMESTVIPEEIVVTEEPFINEKDDITEIKQQEVNDVELGPTAEKISIEENIMTDEQVSNDEVTPIGEKLSTEEVVDNTMIEHVQEKENTSSENNSNITEIVDNAIVEQVQEEKIISSEDKSVSNKLADNMMVEELREETITSEGTSVTNEVVDNTVIDQVHVEKIISMEDKSITNEIVDDTMIEVQEEENITSDDKSVNNEVVDHTMIEQIKDVQDEQSTSSENKSATSEVLDSMMIKQAQGEANISLEDKPVVDEVVDNTMIEQTQDVQDEQNISLEESVTGEVVASLMMEQEQGEEPIFSEDKLVANEVEDNVMIEQAQDIADISTDDKSVAPEIVEPSVVEPEQEQDIEMFSTADETVTEEVIHDFMVEEQTIQQEEIVFSEEKSEIEEIVDNSLVDVQPEQDKEVVFTDTKSTSEELEKPMFSDQPVECTNTSVEIKTTIENVVDNSINDSQITEKEIDLTETSDDSMKIASEEVKFIEEVVTSEILDTSTIDKHDPQSPIMDKTQIDNCEKLQQDDTSLTEEQLLPVTETILENIIIDHTEIIDEYLESSILDKSSEYCVDVSTVVPPLSQEVEPDNLQNLKGDVPKLVEDVASKTEAVDFQTLEDPKEDQSVSIPIVDVCPEISTQSLSTLDESNVNESQLTLPEASTSVQLNLAEFIKTHPIPEESLDQSYMYSFNLDVAEVSHPFIREVTSSLDSGFNLESKPPNVEGAREINFSDILLTYEDGKDIYDTLVTSQADLKSQCVAPNDVQVKSPAEQVIDKKLFANQQAGFTSRSPFLRQEGDVLSEGARTATDDSTNTLQEIRINSDRSAEYNNRDPVFAFFANKSLEDSPEDLCEVFPGTVEETPDNNFDLQFADHTYDDPKGVLGIDYAINGIVGLGSNSSKEPLLSSRIDPTVAQWSELMANNQDTNKKVVTLPAEPLTTPTKHLCHNEYIKSFNTVEVTSSANMENPDRYFRTDDAKVEQTHVEVKSPEKPKKSPKPTPVQQSKSPKAIQPTESKISPRRSPRDLYAEKESAKTKKSSKDLEKEKEVAAMMQIPVRSNSRTKLKAPPKKDKNKPSPQHFTSPRSTETLEKTKETSSKTVSPTKPLYDFSIESFLRPDASKKTKDEEVEVVETDLRREKKPQPSIMEPLRNEKKRKSFEGPPENPDALFDWLKQNKDQVTPKRRVMPNAEVKPKVDVTKPDTSKNLSNGVSGEFAKTIAESTRSAAASTRTTPESTQTSVDSTRKTIVSKSAPATATSTPEFTKTVAESTRSATESLRNAADKFFAEQAKTLTASMRSTTTSRSSVESTKSSPEYVKSTSESAKATTAPQRSSGEFVRKPNAESLRNVPASRTGPEPVRHVAGSMRPESARTSESMRTVPPSRNPADPLRPSADAVRTTTVSARSMRCVRESTSRSTPDYSRTVPEGYERVNDNGKRTLEATDERRTKYARHPYPGQSTSDRPDASRRRGEHGRYSEYLTPEEIQQVRNSTRNMMVNRERERTAAAAATSSNGLRIPSRGSSSSSSSVNGHSHSHGHREIPPGKWPPGGSSSIPGSSRPSLKVVDIRRSDRLTRPEERRESRSSSDHSRTHHSSERGRWPPREGTRTRGRSNSGYHRQTESAEEEEDWINKMNRIVDPNLLNSFGKTNLFN